MKEMLNNTFAIGLIDSLLRVDPAASSLTLASVYLLCNELEKGNSCIELSRFAGQALDAESQEHFPSVKLWIEELTASSLVGRPNDYTPLILDYERLYLARYFDYEQRLIKRIKQMCAHPPIINTVILQQSLSRLFSFNKQKPDWQCVAAAQAVRHRLSIISGGPGTGKTTTIVRVLAALLEQSVEPLTITLAAPTGKAASRMAEAILQAKNKLPISAEIKAGIPEESYTLHRLLGSQKYSSTVIRNANNLLITDVLIVDEASMIDLAMMTKLLEALPQKARLVLLGDKDQLAAIEPGVVFSELCKNVGFNVHEAHSIAAITKQEIPVVASTSLLRNSVVLLQQSHRFADDSAIGLLSRAINQGDTKSVLRLLQKGDHSLSWCSQPELSCLIQRILSKYDEFIQAAQTEKADPARIFLCFNQFRVLAAQRLGRWGVDSLNKLVERTIKHQLHVSDRQQWFSGRVIMIQNNHYRQNLFNGDIGICLKTSEGYQVFFESEQGSRAYFPGQLPAYESAWIMTVHKSQGSEFSQILLVLPEVSSPLLTRSLFYTAVTRAKESVDIWGPAEQIKTMTRKQNNYTTGLANRLIHKEALSEQAALF